VNKLANSTFKLGAWKVDTTNSRISQASVSHTLPPHILSLLLVLVSRHGQVVSRDTLLSEVWKDTIVSDDSISRAVSDLRNFLGDSARSPTYVATLNKQGYKLLVEPQFNTTLKDRKNKHYGAFVLATLLMVAVGVLAYRHVIQNLNTPYETPQLARLSIDTDGTSFPRRPRFDSTGRFVVTEAGEKHISRSLLIHDLKLNKMQVIGPPKNLSYSLPMFSPNNDELIFFEHEPSSIKGNHYAPTPKELPCNITSLVFKTQKRRVLASCNQLFDGSYDLSPDGKKLYASIVNMDKAQAAIVEIDLATGERTVIIEPTENKIAYLFPRVSLSGKKILLIRNAVVAGASEILIFDFDTKELSSILKFSHVIDQVVWNGENDFYYSFSEEYSSGIWQYSLTSNEKKLVFNEDVLDFDFSQESGNFSSVLRKKTWIYMKPR